MEYKFKEGDIVRHAATKERNGMRMIIIGTGYMKDANGETNTYLCSGEKENFQIPAQGIHFRTTLQENELTLCD